MGCTTTDDTNRTLDVVIAGVEELISWALADAQHARKSDAAGTARDAGPASDDMVRVGKLMRALKQLEGCRR